MDAFVTINAARKTCDKCGNRPPTRSDGKRFIFESTRTKRCYCYECIAAARTPKDQPIIRFSNLRRTGNAGADISNGRALGEALVRALSASPLDLSAGDVAEEHSPVGVVSSEDGEQPDVSPPGRHKRARQSGGDTGQQ